jgi:hypothetical protein
MNPLSTPVPAQAKAITAAAGGAFSLPVGQWLADIVEAVTEAGLGVPMPESVEMVLGYLLAGAVGYLAVFLIPNEGA